jgi:hypothetical protein
MVMHNVCICLVISLVNLPHQKIDAAAPERLLCMHRPILISRLRALYALS